MSLSQKSLSYSQITRSDEIQSWLNQFDSEFRPVAIEMLCRLSFISRDTYSLWLKSALAELADEPIALFAVRKFDPETTCIWDDDGNTQQRPAESQGSEDLVQSVVANYLKKYAHTVLDNPGIEAIRSKRIKKIVLLDDSMGSGKTSSPTPTNSNKSCRSRCKPASLSSLASIER